MYDFIFFAPVTENFIAAFSASPREEAHLASPFNFTFTVVIHNVRVLTTKPQIPYPDWIMP